jgi:hypothetical protein
MSLVNDILGECDELAGRLTALRVNYPDTEVRVKHSIFQLRKLMDGKQENMSSIVDDLQDLRQYLVDILKLDPPQLERDFRPCLELIDRLLGPTVQTQVIH